MEGKIRAFKPVKVRKPVDQNPTCMTSPLPKDGSTPNITANKYINKIPITKVGRETPKREIIKIKLLTYPSLFIPVYTPNKTPIAIAITAETKTNSNVAGNLSAIKSETGRLNW